MNIKDIRVVQKLRRRSSLKEVDGEMIVDRWIETTSYKLQIIREGFPYDWEDVEIVEEFEEDE